MGDGMGPIMGSKSKRVRRAPPLQLPRSGSISMVFKAHGLYFYTGVLVVFLVTFWGNSLRIRATIPWHATLYHLFSTRNHPHPLPNCSLTNESTFDKVLMTYIENNSVEKEWRQYLVKEILLENEQGLAWSYKRLVILTQKKLSDPLGHIHAIFRDILMTRANQSTYTTGSMKNLLPNVKSQMDWNYKQLIKNHRGIDVKSLHSDGTSPPPIDRYESCAVVGNSGVLRKLRRGPDIDHHEMVIRINNAVNIYNRNKTFLEEHVGAKTTMTFMNSHILQSCLKKFRRCNCHPYGVGVPIMVYLCVPQHALSVATCAFEHETPIFLTDGRFDAFVSRIARWYSLKHFLYGGKGNVTQWEDAHKHEFHYSSGFQAVIAALALCEKVDLYGFGKDPKVRHHFHSFQKREYYGHDFEAEYLFYNDLEANRIYENPFLCNAGIYIPKVKIFQ